MALGQGPDPPQGIYLTKFSSVGTRTLTQGEDFRLSTRLLEHCSNISPSANQKKVCTQWKIMNDLLPTPSMILGLKIITVKHNLCS